ncbi:MAG: histidine--tRNA ligase [Bacteroidota bacterium]
MKPSIPKGTRDFSPAEMLRRNYLFGIIRTAFARFGYLPLETPSMEQLSTLMGKYGEEGDKLIFKVLDSGEFLDHADREALSNNDSRKFAVSVAEKALRYDLTVPFARYVVMHQHEIVFPFRRYQIQPVWRADRPQKGRYREFYQCDADVIGSDSLLCEAELVQLLEFVFSAIGLKVVVQLNNRKLLAGLAEVMGVPERLTDITVAMDKLEKVGLDKVREELTAKGVSAQAMKVLEPVLLFTGGTDEKLSMLESVLAPSETGIKGIEEMQALFSMLAKFSFTHLRCELDLSLARGLNYYTGAIIEVKAADDRSKFTSSICGGGRYDDLTGIFGLSGMSGVGISFGADRICDVMEEIGLFPDSHTSSATVLAVNFDGDPDGAVAALLHRLRLSGVNAEAYPDPVKLKKQFAFADAKGIRYVIVRGDEERKSDMFNLKNLADGTQQSYTAEALIGVLLQKH